ncbi:FAD-binding oxidoreductase [Thermosulfuriphilus sp.]
MSLPKPAKEALKDLLGDRLTLAEADRVAYSYDASGLESLPAGVCFPETTAEVAGILRICWEYGIRALPRGAGSSTTGSAVPLEGALVVSSVRLNRILEISPPDLLAVVEPGVVVADLDQALAKKRLFYPPDPASLAFATIGGNIATCAGGPRGLKYGVTRDYVLALEVVLADGTILSLGTKTAKTVVGYDLTRLLVGSEGTLAFVTKATLKVLPKPEAMITALAAFEGPFEAVGSLNRLLASGVLPRTAEFLDDLSISALAERLPSAAARARALLLIELDGSKEAVEADRERLKEALSKARFLFVAETQQQRASLWEARRALPPALRRLRPCKKGEDVVVRRSRLADLVSLVIRLRRKYNLPILCFGHAGDGNLHVNILFDARDPQEKDLAEAARKDLFEAVVAMEGSISGEHGIGLTKMTYLPLEISPRAISLMKGIKKVFDPRGILNPGKIFPP